jgi:hypothetical protein
MMPTWRAILPFLAFLGIIGLALWVSVADHPDGEEWGEKKYKRLSGTVAEGFVYRVGRERHPRVTCSACRVGKVKLGFISLGAFNAIEFDDLVLNIPEVSEKAAPGKRSNHQMPTTQTTKADVADVVEDLNLKPVLTMAHAKAKQFAEIRVSNFQVNKMSGESLKPLVKASLLKNSGRRMILHDVILYKDEMGIALNEAELVVNPRLKLIWSTGSWDLTEILFGSSGPRRSVPPQQLQDCFR